MHKYILYLKNKTEWIKYVKSILDKTENITNETIQEIFTFHFKFDSFDIDS